LCNCGAVLRVKIGINLVEEVERGGIAALNREYEGKCT
jgi:hypothetical protein